MVALLVLPISLSAGAKALRLFDSSNIENGLVVVNRNTFLFSSIEGQINALPDDTTGFVCPDDISIYTDLNSCDALITSDLNIHDPDNGIISLTWKMEGATTGQSPSIGVNQLSSYVFNEGTTIINYFIRDVQGRLFNCTFEVVVVDNQAPQFIFSPGDIIVRNAPGDCNARVNWMDPVVRDNCVSSDQITMESNYNSGDLFPLGSTEVIYHISDGVNETEHRFIVTVVDTEQPRLIAPMPKVIVCGDEVEDAFTIWSQFEQVGGTVSDNCEVDFSSFRYVSQTASDIRCPYIITRTYSIADKAGNVAEVNRIIEVTGEEPRIDQEEPDKSEPVLKSGVEVMASYAQTYSIAGTYTWVCPEGVTSITVECWGGGGGCGTSYSRAGGGAGGGAYASSILNVVPGNSYTVIVGSGGSIGNNGNYSSFGSGPLVRAAGGTRGEDGYGVGGTVANSIGTIRFAGGNGGSRYSSDRTGGGGGGSATSTANGSNGSDGSYYDGGTGGAGQGNGGNGGDQDQSGGTGIAPGGGGGGRGHDGSSSGTGADGQVIITYDVPNGYCAGDANAVYSSHYVDNQDAVVGAEDNIGARLYDNNDRLILDLTGGDLLLAGGTVEVRWRRLSYNHPDISVSISEDALAYTFVNSYNITPYDTWVIQTIPLSIDTRYIEFRNVDGENFEIDAVSYYTPCSPPCTDPDQPSAIVGTTSPCASSSEIYSVTNTSGVNYNWTYSGANVTIANGQGTSSITVNYGSNATSGTWTVTPSDGACTGTAQTLGVTMSTSSTAPASISGTNSICIGSSTTLTTNGGTLGTDAEDVWYEGGCADEAMDEEWINLPYSVENTTVNSLSGGIMSVTSTGIDPMIHMENIGSFNAATYRYMQIRYRVTSGNAGSVEIYYSKTGGSDLSEGQVVRSSLVSDGNWNILNVDMSTSANWNGTITGWRYDWCSQNGVTMQLDFISLSDRPIIGTGASIIVSPDATTTYYTRKKGACSSTSCVSSTVTVNPITVITAQSTDTQTQCVGGTFSPISVSATGTGTLTYQWYRNTSAGTTGGTAIAGATGSGYTPPANTVGTMYYYVIVSSDCGQATSEVSGAFIVNPATTITDQSTGTQTECIGGTFNPISVTVTGTGPLTYQWYRNTSAGTTGGAAIAGATGSGYTPPANTVGTMYYYVIVSSDCGQATSEVSGAFIVNPATTITDQSTDTQTECIGGTFNPISVSATGTGPLTYQWYRNTSAGTTGGTAIAGATGSGYTPPANTVGTMYYYVIVSSDCGQATSEVSGAFIVNPATTITDQSTGTQTECIGGTFNPISVTVTGTGPLTYQWYRNTSAGTTGGAAIAGATGSGYTPPANTVGTMYYYVIVSSDCGQATSEVSGAFIVNPATTITDQSTDTQTECIGGTFNPISVSATGTGPLTYQWYRNTSAGTTGGAAIAGATGSGYTPPANTVGTMYYYVIVSSDCGQATSEVSGAFIVNPATTITDQSTGTQTECIGGTFNPISVSATGTGTLTYQWYRNTSAGTTGGTAIAGATGSGYTPPANTVGTMYYYVIVSSDCGQATSEVSGAFIVNPATTITDQSTDTQTGCIGGTFNPISVTVTGTGPLTYQWYRNTSAGTTGGAAIAGATGSGYTPPANTVGTMYYYVIVSSDCGQATSEVSGAFIVNPATTITDQSTGTQTECIGGTFNPISVSATGTGTLTYQWYRNTSAGTTGGTAIAGATGSGYTPPANTVGTMYYYVIVSSDCGQATSEVSGAFIILDNATVDVGPAISGICQGETTVALGGSFGGSATDATWTSSVGGTFSPGVGQPNHLNATWTPPTGYKGTATLTLTTTGPCAPVSESKTISVYEQPSIAVQPVDMTDCYERIVEFNVTASGAGLSYIWYRYRPGDDIDFVALNGTEQNVDVSTPGVLRLTNVGDNNNNSDGTQYKVLVTSGHCDEESDVVQLSVNRITKVEGSGAASNSTSVTLCSGSNFSYTVETNHPENIVSYQWKKKESSGNWESVVNGSVISGAKTATLVFTNATEDESGEYKVTVEFDATSSADCSVTSDNFNRELTILSVVEASLNSTGQTICAGSAPAQIETTIRGGTGTNYIYQWQSRTNNSSWTDIAGANAVSYQPPVLTESIYYRIVVTDNGDYTCGTANSESVLIAVEEAPTAAGGGDQTTCADEPVNIAGASATNYSGILWSHNGNGTLSDETTLTPTYTPALSDGGTSVTLTMTVTGNNSCGTTTAIASQNVYVNELPSAAISYAGSPYCADGIASVSHTGQNDGTYSSTTGLIIDSSTGQVDLGASTPGTYIVTYEFSDSNGCNNSTTTELTVTEWPLAETGPDGNICVGGNVQIGAPAKAGHTYSWSTDISGAPVISTDAQLTVSPATTTTYYLTEIITSTGCENSNSVTVTTDQDIDVTITPSSLDICSGETTAIELSSNYIGAAFTWTATLKSPGTETTGYTASGSGASINDVLVNTSSNAETVRYAVTATVGSCFNADRFIDVMVYPETEKPSVTAGSSTELCEGENVLLTSSVSSGNQWYRDGNQLSGETGQTYTASEEGSYTVEFTDANSCKALSNPVDVTVNPLPTADISGNNTICEGESTDLTFNLTGTQPWSITYTDGTTPTTISGITSTPHTISVNPSTTSTYEITAVNDANCTGTFTGSAVVTVNPLPTAALSGTSATCNGTPALLSIDLTGTAPWTIEYTDGTTPVPVDNILTTPHTIEVSPTTNTFYSLLSVSDANCLGNVSGTADITVNEIPTAIISGTNEICDSETTTISIELTGVAPWELSYSDGTTTTPVSGITGTPYEFNVSPGATTTYEISDLSDANCQGTYTGSAVVTVKPIPSATISGTITVCEGETEPAVLFTGTNGTAPYTFTYEINGGNNEIVETNGGSSAVVFAPTNVPGTYVYELLRVEDGGSNGCRYDFPSLSQTVTVTVEPRPTVTFTADKTEACLNEAPGPVLTFSASGGTAPYTFTYSLNNGSFQTIITPSGQDFVEITVPATAAGNFIYELTSISDNSASGCLISVSEIVTVTVHELPETPDAGDLAVCYDGNEHTASASAGVNESIVWYDAAVGGNVVSVPTGTEIGSYTAYAAAISDQTGCESVDRVLVTLTIDPVPTVTAPIGLTFCEGVPSVPYVLSGMPTGVTFDISGGNLIGLSDVAGVSEIPSFVPEISGGVNTATITVIPKANGCEGDAVTFVVTIRPTPTVTISGGATLCQNSTPPNLTFTNPQSLPVIVTYNIEGGAEQTISISENTTANVAVPTNNSGVFTYNITGVEYQTTPNCQNAISGLSAVFEILPVPTATISGTTTVCQNSSPDPDIIISNIQNLPITVTYNINGSNQGTIDIDPNSTETINAPTDVAGTFEYNLETVVYQGATACVNNISGSAAITVRPAPAVNISSDKTIVCKNSVFPVVRLENPQAFPITVEYTLNGGAIITQDILQGATHQIQVNTTNVGDFTYKLVSVKYQDAPECSESITDEVTVSILPKPTAAIGGSTQVCQNSSPNPVVTFSNSENYAITIAYNINGVIQPEVNIDALGIFTTEVLTTNPGTFTYNLENVAYRDFSGCENNAPGGSATVVVRPEITATATIDGDAIVCQNSSPSPNVVFTNPQSYPITVNYTDNGTTMVQDIAANGTVSIPVSTTTPGTRTFSLESIQYQDSPECLTTIAGGDVTITILPIPQATITGTATVCPDDPEPDITFNNAEDSPVIITYDVNGTNETTIEVSANSSATVQAPTNTSGTFNYNLVNVRYRDGLACTNTTTGSFATVTVLPAPTVTTDLTNLQYCAELATDPVPLTGTPSGLVFDITGGASIGLPDQTDVTEIPSFNPINIGTTDIVANLLLTVKSLDCTTGNVPFTITVNPNPVVNCPADFSLCLTDAPITLSGATPVGGTYTGAGVTAGGFDPGVADVGMHTITYEVASVNGCVNYCSFEIEVSEVPVIFNYTEEVCTGLPFSITPTNGEPTVTTYVPSGTTYSWSAPTVTGGMAGGASGTNELSISGLLVNNTNNPQTATYTVTPWLGSCSGDPFTVIVTVNPSLDLNITATFHQQYLNDPSYDYLRKCNGEAVFFAQDDDLEVGVWNGYQYVMPNPGYFSSYTFEWQYSLVGPGGPWLNALDVPTSWLSNDYEYKMPDPVNSPFSPEGDYYFRFVVISDDGCITSTDVIHLEVISDIEIDAGETEFVTCSSSPSAIPLTGASVTSRTGGYACASWEITSLNPANGANVGSLSPSNQICSTNPQNTTYTPPANYVGEITLTLGSNDPDGPSDPCIPVYDTRTIIVNAVAGAFAGNPITTCAGQSVQLNGSIEGTATGATWSVSPGNGGTFSNANALNSTFTPSISSGNLTLTLTPNVSGSCVQTGTTTVTVNQAPLTTGIEICPGETGELTSSTTCPAGTANSVGPYYPGTGENQSGIGSRSWRDPEDALTNNGWVAYVDVGDDGEISNYLKVSDFGFNIPGNAIMEGIEVRIGRYTSGSSTPRQRDYEVRLVKNNTVTGNNLAKPDGWPTSEQAEDYGGSNNLWGESWTAADINSSQFGVALSVINPHNYYDRTAYVDYIRVTVHYRVGGELQWFTSESGGSPIGTGSPFNPVGVTGSPLVNTDTPGTYTFYAECPTYDGCRIATDFVINDYPEVTVPDNYNESACSFTSQTEVDAEFNNWLAGFTVTGGANPTGVFQGTPGPPDLQAGGAVTVYYDYTDDCETGTEIATFTIDAPEPLVITKPNDTTTNVCDFVNQAALDVAFNNWLAEFTVSGGCTPSGDYGVPAAPSLCVGGDVTVDYVVSNLGENFTQSAMFTLSPVTELIIDRPDDYEAPSCSFANQAEVNDAFTTWLDGFDVVGGCSGAWTIGTPVAPDLCTGGTTEVTLSYNDVCRSESEVARFTITRTDDFVATAPDNYTQAGSDFADQTALDAAFTNWLTGFAVSGGCAPVGDFGNPTAPQLCSGGMVTVDYNYSDLCESGTLSRTFTVTMPDALVVNNPGDYDAQLCDFTSQEDVNTAFENWLTGFYVVGGCNPIGDYGTPTAPDLCSTTGTTVTFNYSDCCENGSVEATFSIVNSEVFEIHKPDPFVAPPCNYADQNELNAAFQTWLTGFSVSGGCIPGGDYGNPVPPNLCSGGIVEVDYTADDVCDSGSMSSTFEVEAVTELIAIAPGNQTEPACQTQEAIDAAFATWLSQFTYTGGCHVTETDLSSYTAPDACGGNIIVNYTVTDACGQADNASAYFTIDIPNDVLLEPTFDVPADITIYTDADCDYNADPSVTGEPTNTDDNCAAAVSLIVDYADVESDGDCNGDIIITRVWTVTDNCGNATSKDQVIAVEDNTPPEITCPADVSATVDDNECFVANLDIGTATGSDNCSDVAITNNLLDQFPTGEVTVGTHIIVWAATDSCGNSSICEQTITVSDNNEAPTITCPENVEQTAGPNNCYLENVTIADPTYDDNCGVITLTWSYTDPDGDVHNSPATGINFVSGQTFEVGTTTVTYVAGDAAGHSVSCSFDVTILHIEIPQANFTCPQDTVRFVPNAGDCEADVTLGALTYTDPCNEIDSVWNDSPYRTSPANASGTYPVDTTTFNWYITDISGNIDSCTVTVIVEDLPPTITCPPDVDTAADYGQQFNSGVALQDPSYSDNCPDPELSWRLIPSTDYESEYNAAELSGTDIYSSPDTFWVGVTTIWYYVEDANGNRDSCNFTVTIEAAPEIECPPSDTFYVDNRGCTYPFDPGIPSVVNGAIPFDWTWTMEGANTGTGTTNNADLPNPIGTVNFNLGLITITWTAENPSGADTCNHHILVIDTIPPTLTADPYENCVDPLHWAVYNEANPNPVYNHVDPLVEKFPVDYRTLFAGDEFLDLTSLEDNCCDSTEMTIHWRIEFSDTPDPVTGAAVSHSDITGTGQPSEYEVGGIPTDIYLWGDGVTFSAVTHQIYYWVEDCNGNTSEEIRAEITITPRPEVKKEGY